MTEIEKRSGFQTTDLTKNTTPFGLLDVETKAAMQAHGGPYEIFTQEGWKEIAKSCWWKTSVYRVKPQPPTKDSIDWSHVDDGIVAIARDECGSTLCYSNVPSDMDCEWDGEVVITRASVFASYRPGTCDWRDSLIIRPGYTK